MEQIETHTKHLDEIVVTLEYYRDMRGKDGDFRVGLPMDLFTNLDDFLDKRFTKLFDCNYKWLDSRVEFYLADNKYPLIN